MWILNTILLTGPLKKIYQPDLAGSASNWTGCWVDKRSGEGKTEVIVYHACVVLLSQCCATWFWCCFLQRSGRVFIEMFTEPFKHAVFSRNSFSHSLSFSPSVFTVSGHHTTQMHGIQTHAFSTYTLKYYIYILSLIIIYLLDLKNIVTVWGIQSVHSTCHLNMLCMYECMYVVRM